MSEKEDFSAEELRKILDGDGNENKRLPDFGSKIPKEINPPNFIKQKVGAGGLSEGVLQKAQKLIDNNSVDFVPIGQKYLGQIESVLKDIHDSKSHQDDKDYLNRLLTPTMQLKANGGMFKFELVTKIADLFCQYIESIKVINSDAVEVLNGFYTAIRAVIISEIRGDGGKDGDELINELKSAWVRYRQKNAKK